LKEEGHLGEEEDDGSIADYSKLEESKDDDA
jgi:hypothetical protein